jgi:ABC-type glycerol-3-phosphate transport system permease component
VTKVGTFPTERSFGERSSVARMYRSYLAKASITMFAFIVVAAYLLPLLYMVTTSFQQPSQVSDPDAPPWPAAPLTATYEGTSYPLYSVPFPTAPRAS